MIQKERIFDKNCFKKQRVIRYLKWVNLWKIENEGVKFIFILKFWWFLSYVV